MLKVVKSNAPIVDGNLSPQVWVNTSGEMHWFESYLERVYPGATDLLVANPLKIMAPNGERTFLPHTYYNHFTASGRGLEPASGRWELFARKEHSGALNTFLRRYFSNRECRG